MPLIIIYNLNKILSPTKPEIMNTEKETKEESLWRMAKKRAKFKRSLIVYIIMNTFFWLIWYFNGQRIHFPPELDWGNIPWPLWVMLGWGLGLVFKYIDAYHSTQSLEEREYEKLKNKNL
jgi:hypothetical protein